MSKSQSSIPDTVQLVAHFRYSNGHISHVSTRFDLRWSHEARDFERQFNGYRKLNTIDVDVHYESNESDPDNDHIQTYNAWLDSLNATPDAPTLTYQQTLPDFDGPTNQQSRMEVI